MINIKRKINSNTFYFDYRKAVYWDDEKTLILADLHVGKVMHFRKNGSALPMKASSNNLVALIELINFYNAKKVIFLGDLFHSSFNLEWNEWINFFNSSGLNFTLVIGNHDKETHIIKNIEKLNIVFQLELNGFLLSHHPKTKNGYVNFCGHIHPSISLSLIGNRKIKLQCFSITKNQVVFPAFGKFTGSFEINKQDDMEYLIIGEKRIFQKV